MRTYARPIFARRHYEAVAELIRFFDGIGNRAEIAAEFVEMFARDNWRFKPERFLRAAGLNGGPND